MAEQLKNILSFNLAAGASVVLPHDLQTSLGTPLEPDVVFIPSPGLDVEADDIDVELTNVSGEALAGSILVESWHTIERAFGDKAIVKLTPQPYIVVSVEGGNEPPQPPFSLTTIIIYARTTGSDTTGNGRTIPTAYHTFQRAIRDVPSVPAPGARYVVDITGLGVEPLPDQYTFPSIRFPTMTYGNDTESVPCFYSGTGLRIRAIPQLVAAIPSAEAVIDAGAGAILTSDPDTNLITLLIPSERMSWTTANLRNKQIIRTVGSHKAGCVIVAATHAPGLSTLTLANDIDNFNGGGTTGTGDNLAVAAGIVTLTDAGAAFFAEMVGSPITIEDATTPANNGTFVVTAYVSPTQIKYANAVGLPEAFPGTWIVGAALLSLAPGEVLQIVEASATLEGGTSPDMDYNNNYGFAAIQTRVNSIAFQGIKITSRVPGSTAIAILDCPMTDIELCDIAGINGQGYAGTYWMLANGCVIRSNLLAVNCSFFTHACHLDTIDFFYMANATPQSFASSILTDCAQYASPEITGLPIVCNTAFANCLLDNSGAVVDHGGGISVTQGHLALDHVQINDVTGNAIEVLQGSFAVLNRVTGTGNVGQGVLASDGSQVQADETTTIGDDGPRAYTNGTAPGTPIVVGTWPAAPDNSTNATTFSRVFVPA